MKKFRIFLTLFLMILGTAASWAEFKDFSAVLNNQEGTLLTAEEQVQGTEISFGVAVDAQGVTSRVAADDASAVATIKGKYHSDHGMTNLVVNVPVEGGVKITVGACTYSGSEINVKVDGNVVVSKAPLTACWKNDRANVTELYYTGEPATLEISGMGYCPYIAVAKNENPVARYDISFSLGDAQGVAPATVTWTEGDEFKIPANFTMYKEGMTLVGWKDSQYTHAPGEIFVPAQDVTLEPVWAANQVSLADRTDAVTLRWDFQRQNGAPTVGWQNQDGLVWVTQAQIGTQAIDVPLFFSTNPGKFANANWTDWCQLNGGTTFQVPSCKGAQISLEAYAETNTTCDGLAPEVPAKVPVWTVLGDAETVPVVIGDQGSYYRYIQSVLPYVEPSAAGTKYENEPASAVWAMDDEINITSVLNPANGFTMSSFNLNGAAITGTGTSNNHPGQRFIKIRPANGASDQIEWSVKPSKGLTFVPTRLEGDLVRFGTDSERGVTISAQAGDGEVIKLGTFTAPRNNKDQAGDKFGQSDWTPHFVIELTPEQQAALTATGVNFKMLSTVGVGNAKEAGFGNMTITGTLSGEILPVDKYTVKVFANPEDAAKVSVYPAAEEYDAESVVRVSAVKNFGYEFVNWTDAEGKEVSKDATFEYEVLANAELTANFNKLNTYELSYSVAGGANDYQVQPTPAPTVVDGKNMYEEGTTVTLTATSNRVVTFTNWSNGETTSEITVPMTENKALVANFSAIDYLAGWDFMRAGSNGRPADFASADNDDKVLVLRDEAGNQQGWLDKSEFGAGGYEGRPAAVNWRTDELGKWYWQTMVNATAFKNLKLATAMLCNYNAYSKYDVQYSLDGQAWETIGSVVLEGTKNWKDAEFDVPAAANNQPAVYFRWIADKTSQVLGTTSNNDGITLGASFIIGDEEYINDGVAPVLVSTVPAEGSTTATTNGRVVLTYDEKVSLKEGAKAKLGDLELAGEVSGKTITFPYKSLAYGTEYTFSLDANTVADLGGNYNTQAVSIKFTTKTRPAVAKGLYDEVVSNVDELLAAIAKAEKRADTSKRFRIFIKNGEYKIPASATATKTNGNSGKTYADPTTYINTPNISFVGESIDGVRITNTLPENPSDAEGIGSSDVLDLNSKATNSYIEGLTLYSSMGDAKGRDIVLHDKSDKTVVVRAQLWAYQDTYVSNNDKGRYYFEDGVIRGRTDYICGKGDIFFNQVNFQQVKGGYLAVPSVPKKYGWILNECTINGETDDVDGNYTLGRPWGSGTPIALYINTKMNVKPSAIGWNEMSGGYPKRFAEYNSMTANGNSIDLSQRKTIFGDTHENNPVLTAEEAALYTVETVMGGDDDWDPVTIAEPAPLAQNVTVQGANITWDANDYVLLWAIVKDGKVVDFVTEPSYTFEDGHRYAIRSANEMGGLGEEVSVAGLGINNILAGEASVVKSVYYNVQGVRVLPTYQGVLLRVDTLSDGQTVTTKIVNK